MDERTAENPETEAGSPQEPDHPYTPPSDGKGVLMKGAPLEEFAARSALSREPLTRTERLLITMFVTMFAAMLGAGALGFTAISGQLLDMQKQIGGLRTDMQTEIGGVETEIGNLRTEMQKQISNLRTDMQKQIGELSERMARVETLIETRLIPQASAPTPAGS